MPAAGTPYGDLGDYSGTRRPPRAHSRRRGSAAVILVLAGLLAAASAFLPWWYFTVSTSGQSVTIDFYPGSDYSGSLSGNTSGHGMASYQAGGIGAEAALYEAAFGIVLLSAVLLVLAGILGFLTERGALRGRWEGNRSAGIAILAFLLVLGGVVAVAASQPTQFAAANPGGFCTSTADDSSTPCTTFSGSVSASDGSASWGGASGWFAAIAAAVLGLVGIVVWVAARNDAWEIEPIAASPIGPVGSGWPAPPAISLGYGAAPPDPWTLAPADIPPTPSFAAGAPVSPYSASPGGVAAARFRPALQLPSTPPPPPPVRLASVPPALAADLTEVQQLLLLKQQLDAGAITAEAFTRSKAQLVRAVTTAPAGPGTAGVAHRDLGILDRLRDEGAVTGPEYLQLRRGVILRG